MGSLQRTADYHRGLQLARSLGLLRKAGIVPVNETQGGFQESKPAASAKASKTVGATQSKAQPEAATPSPASKADFNWPSTAARETEGSEVGEVELNAESRLRQLGYRFTGLSPAQRWQILRDKAVPELGLREVANTIAWLCRMRRKQRNGQHHYRNAISGWEHDLERLRRELYDKGDQRFTWPETRVKDR